MTAPNFIIPVDESTVIGKFTYKFDRLLNLSVQWREDVGFVPLRTLPAQTESVTLTVSDMQQAYDFMTAFEAQPFNWGY